jgi:hypothetical protein
MTLLAFSVAIQFAIGMSPYFLFVRFGFRSESGLSFDEILSFLSRSCIYNLMNSLTMSIRGFKIDVRDSQSLEYIINLDDN